MKKYFLLIFFIIFPLSASALEVLGYIYRSDSVSHLRDDTILRQQKSLREHIAEIQIITPQAYQINEKGIFWGSVDPAVLSLAKAHKAKVMPLVTNVDFNSARTTTFLKSPEAQHHAILAMVAACKKDHLAGLQIDFEHLPLADKADFTHFIQQAATALHHNGFLISVAIIPRLGNALTSGNERAGLEFWDGAYDYAALGKATDFVTLMAYDQHTAYTTPGSSCEPDWLKSIIVYALKYIPASKISLGLPVHSSYWYSTTHSTETDITYAQAHFLLMQAHTQWVWDKQENVPYAIFSKDNLNRYIFPQDAATFRIQWAMAKKYKLRGVSLWCLGFEDPAIWKLMA